jgi:hypothetical protein
MVLSPASYWRGSPLNEPNSVLLRKLIALGG